MLRRDHRTGKQSYNWQSSSEFSWSSRAAAVGPQLLIRQGQKESPAYFAANPYI